MPWIDEIKAEVRELDLTRKNLRRFGLMVGGVFLFLALFFFFKDFTRLWVIIPGAAGALLVAGGAIAPAALKWFYIPWMALALALGWFVSRLLLTLLYYLVLTPLALLSRLLGKKFVSLAFRVEKESYWIRKENPETDYEKMS